jgi:hypothetical protein
MRRLLTKPPQWMLEVIGAAPGTRAEKDWTQVWNDSPERAEVRAELDTMKVELAQKEMPVEDAASLQEFAAPFRTQLWEVLMRVFEQYWRTPVRLVIFRWAWSCVTD